MGLDLSADGMAVLTTVPGKAKERVRVHAQLGDFPLLTDARVVRMSKRRGGYRWALRFEQMDERMRSNLEAFVRQQLASAARVRQAQLYAQRLKGGALPPIPTGPATVAEPVLPTPGPLPAVDPAEAPPGATPLELDVEAPAVDVEPQRVLEIELPPMEPTEAPPLDRGAVAPPESQEAYDPYQASDAQGEAAMLDVGPIEPVASLAAPESPAPPTPAAAPASPEPASTPEPTEDSVAHTFTPGVIEIDENEDLSLEDILSEVEGGDAPVSDLGLPPPQEKAADASGLGDVPVVDAQMGDEEETRRRDSSIPDQPAGEALRAQVDASAAPAAEVPPKGNTLIADAAPSPLPDAEGDATVPLSGALPEVPSGKSTLIGGSQPYVPSTSSDIGGLPFGTDGHGDEEDSAEIALDSLEPSFGDTPAPRAPSPISASDDDAAALVPSLGDPAPTAEPPPAVDDGPQLDDALAQDDAPSLAGAPGFDARPEAQPDATDATEAPVLHDDEGLDPADLAQVAPPFTATPIPGSVPSAVPSLDSALLRTTPTPPPGSQDASFHASPSPFYDGPEPAAEFAESEVPEPFAEVEPQSAVPTPVAEVEESAEEDDDEPPQPPAFLDEEPAASSGPVETPAPASPPLYADDAEPFDPYAPNPPSTVGAASPRIGSAPRALGELPPVVAGLYTPASNPSVDEDSGAYASASFEPFPSAEAGLYGDRSDVTFEEQQGNPRQRLAFLQHDDTKGVPEHHEHFLGDIEGVTSGLTPTSYKRSMTDEDLAPSVPAVESAAPPVLGGDASTSVEAAPELVEAEPTRPVDVGPAEFTPPPTDVESLGSPEGAALTPEPEELSMEDVEFEDSKVAAPGAQSQSRGLATYPEFNVIPDFDQAPQSDPRASEPPPAQTGKTMVASLESLGMLRPPDGGPMPAPASSPADFAPVASFGGTQAPLAGFTVVAQLDDGDDDSPGTLSGSTMIATAEDVEAWKVAALASQEKKPAFDEERTVAFTPAPGSLEPINPAVAPFGAPPMGEDDLTAMRVGRGGPSPSGGAGFELNPRGPAPAAAPPPSAPLARLPLAKMPVQARPGATIPAPSNRNGDTVPVPSRPVAQAEPLPSARPTLPPGNPRLPARGVARPGASSRSGTALESGGRPAPPPKPQARPQPQSAEQTLRKVPAVQGSGSMSPPASKKSLVEDALAQLKRKTEEKRKGRGGSDENPKGGAEAAAKPTPKRQANRTRRRKRLGAAELVDPAIAELYKAAMTDLDGSRD